MELTLDEAASAVEGSLSGKLTATARPTGVSIDSRSIRRGELFFAIVGPRFDGHDFVSEAFEAGALCAVVDAAHGAGRPRRRPIIAVEDTVKALQSLSSHYRGVLGCEVIAVTGSNGKTSTKDLMAHVLAASRRVGGTQGNLNNYLGVPLTLLTLRPYHDVAVVEMGASARGEIRDLARIARPCAGVITNVGPTHLEGLGSVAAVAEAKAELASELPPGGTLVVNGDDDVLLGAVRATSRGDLRLVRCGFGRGNDVKASGSSGLGPRGTEFDVEGHGTAVVPAIGRHSVYNALMAIAVGIEMGMTFAEVRERLAGFRPPAQRLEPRRAGDVVILNDSYNSNPASAAAALAALREYPCSGRRVAVLGDMLELGAASSWLHRELGEKASFVDWLLTVGACAEDVAAAAVDAGLERGRAAAFADKAALKEALLDGLKVGDVVLVKASRALGMEEIAKAIERSLGS